MKRVSDDMINMMLRQMGAKSINYMPAYVNVINFEIGEDLTVGYIYNANEDGDIYLQRTSPYAMRIGKMYSELDVIDFIDRDIERFRNAYKSHNFQKFVKITNAFNQLDKAIEGVFMLKNVSGKDLDKCLKMITTMENIINDMDEKSPCL